MNLRDYQLPAVTAMANTYRGILHCPAGGGKTIIEAAAIDRVMTQFPDSDRSIVWLANTREQCQQAHDALNLFAIQTRCKVEIGCYAGVSPAFVARCSLLVVDECHHAGADQLSELIEHSQNARHGLTATPNRADERKQLVHDLFGGIAYQVTREQIGGQMAKGKVLWATVPGGFQEKVEAAAKAEFKTNMKKWMRMELTEEELKLWPKLLRHGQVVKRIGVINTDEQIQRSRWRFALQLGILQNEERDALIEDCFHDSQGRGATLIVVSTIEHGTKLSERLNSIPVIHARLPKKQRKAFIDGLRDGTIPGAIATSLADEGLDVPRLAGIVMASAGRSAIKIEQRSGRVMRSFTGKDEGRVYDFLDTGHSFLSAQSTARKRIYNKLGYTSSLFDSQHVTVTQ